MKLRSIVVFFLVILIASAADDPLDFNSSDDQKDPLALNLSINLEELEALLSEPEIQFVNYSDKVELHNETTPHASIPFARFFRNDTLFNEFVNLTSTDLKPPYINQTWSESFFEDIFEVWW
ncbi:MAG: hypothetical protein ACXQT4_04225 [Methanotrichaceae archaeon]